MNNETRINILKQEKTLPYEDMKILLTTLDASDEALLYQAARDVRNQYYGRDVYLRGLIEFTSYCRNDCKYCGLRRSNQRLARYRLSQEEILNCAEQGYDLGFRTIVLQGGEDLSYSCEMLCELIREIKRRHPDCAITLSIGEKSYEEYLAYYHAGADRYLLRHETSNPEHYRYLHPSELTIENRKRCLDDLKSIGYQVGCGIMVNSPGQTIDHILEDLYYMKDFHPHMVGIGPFIPHQDTPFKDEPRGTLEDTLHLLAVIRLMIPDVLLPATTALGTIDEKGREKGILAGANVIMPNLSPINVRGKYMLYDGKISTGEEAAESYRLLAERIAKINYRINMGRGDHIQLKRHT
ncbi:MAG: [FeFe] hydrogenase H-cluster radical SAM maturase HydE [bacterium]